MVTISTMMTLYYSFVGITIGGVVGGVSDGVERVRPRAEWWMRWRWAWHAWLKTIP